MRRLTRYVIGEISGPLAIGFLIYTSILLIQFLFQSAELIIQKSVPPAQVGQIILYNLPHIIAISIPMALLFAVLVAIARLSADSEVTAMRACGQSLLALLRPVLAVSAIIALINVGVMAYVLPRGNSAAYRLQTEIVKSSIGSQIEPRVFFDRWIGVLLWVFDTQPGEDEWRGVFMADSTVGRDSRVNIAESGRVFLDYDSRQIVLDLHDVVTHKVDFNDPATYEVTTYEELTEVVEDPTSTQRELWHRQSKGLRELTLGELTQRLENPSLTPELRNMAWVEIHKKFSIPVACLVFGLLGLGLGFTRRRGGSRTAGFALSIGVIVVYYVLQSNGEEMAQVGRIPGWLAMWFPNFLLGAAGAVLLLRRNRDRPLSPAFVDRWLRRHLWRLDPRRRRRREDTDAAAIAEDATGSPLPRRAAAHERPRFVVRLPSLQFGSRFLYRLDRYVLKQFVWAFGLILLGALVVFTTADFTERTDDIFENDVPGQVIVNFYKYQILQRIYDIAPFVVLVTTLAVFGMLSKSNEVVAAKASGISVFRLAVPALIGALAVAGVCGGLQARVLPSSNQKMAQLEDRIRGHQVVRSYRRADRNWLFGQGRYIYNYLGYDRTERSIRRLQVFEFDEKHRLVRRLYADRATYVGDGWRFEDAWYRTFDGITTTEFKRFEQPVIDHFPETPEYFEGEVRKPAALSFAELSDYIRELEGSGQKVPDLKVELHKKIGYPAICLVMALVALPFSFRLGRKGALYGVGIGIVLGMVFLAVFAVFTTLGNTGVLGPLVAVWSPSIAFILMSLYMFLGVET